MESQGNVDPEDHQMNNKLTCYYFVKFDALPALPKQTTLTSLIEWPRLFNLFDY